MSRLTERLAEAAIPKKKPSAFQVWYSALSEDEQAAVWQSLNNTALKTYTLFPILQEEGLRVSKDTFKPLRDGVLDGTIKEEDLHVS